jgi:hypothetical protein
VSVGSESNLQYHSENKFHQETDVSVPQNKAQVSEESCGTMKLTRSDKHSERSMQTCLQNRFKKQKTFQKLVFRRDLLAVATSMAFLKQTIKHSSAIS